MQKHNQQLVFQDRCPKCNTFVSITTEGGSSCVFPLDCSVVIEKMTRCDGCRRMVVTAFLPNGARVHWMQSEESLDNATVIKSTRLFKFHSSVTSAFYLYTPLVADRQSILSKLDAFITENLSTLGEIVLIDWSNGACSFPLPKSLVDKAHLLVTLPSSVYAGFDGMKSPSLFAEKVVKKFAFSEKMAIVYSVYPSFCNNFHPFRYMDSEVMASKTPWTEIEMEFFRNKWAGYTSTETLYVGVTV